MSDDLDDLKSLMNAATPRPDAARRAENIALAQKNFADLQGSRDEPRPTSDRPKTGLISGVRNMLNTLTSRAGLTASTAIVAVGLVVMTPIGDGLMPNNGLGEPAFREKMDADDFADPIIEAPVIIEAAPAPQMEMAAPDLTATSGLSATSRKTALGNAPISPNAAPNSNIAFGGNARFAIPKSGRSQNQPPLNQTVESIDDFGIDFKRDAHNEALNQRIQNYETMIERMRKGQVQGAIVSSNDLERRLQELAALKAEAFANADANPVHVTNETPVSTFSIDVDTASYSVIRNALTSGQLPPRDAVRVEEMINYFPYDYFAPTDGAAFQPTVSITQTPWNPDTQLMQIAVQGAEITERPPLNLVFLIDTSGSMNRPNKLPLLKQSFRLMLGQLRPEDQIAIVTYAGSAGEVLAPTSASERSTILNALNNLDAGGSTAGQAGLQQAYATATAMAEDGEVNRVILATDGDFNVGLNDPQALKDYIADKRDTGTYLSVLGFGRGNLDDATMQALAQNGNGQAAYIDTLSEAQKVLVDQLGGALFPIADDVKIQVEFNPATVSEYRLIGYETRALKREDFNNDKVDAGDIGAGHQVTALYELTPKGSPAELNDPLRYGETTAKSDSEELAFLRLRYKAPGASTSDLIETPITATNAAEPTFAAAIAGFGQLLRNGTYTGDWSYADAIALATQTKGDDPFGYRTEAIQLMRLAQSLSQD